MKLGFWKMSGAGNDFVCVDNRSGRLRLTRRQRERLCHRQSGAGADGLLVLERPGARDGAVDFRMRYYNADGGEADMCGNGARCFARYAQRMARFRRGEMKLRTGAGLVEAKLSGARVEVTLTPPRNLRTGLQVEALGRLWTVHTVDTGVPHAVVFVDDAEAVDVAGLGRALRFHGAFAPAGTNVNFVERRGPGRCRVRTYERGVEGETLACGTGVTAAALVMHAVHGGGPAVELTVQSGAKLRVRFQPLKDGTYDRVRLAGPAEFIYQGEIDV